jgi:hypothetical protein
MARYYHNENPQVTWLMEKVEKLTKDYEFLKGYNRILVEVHNELMLKISEFNKLPWYRKIFYKFKL